MARQDLLALTTDDLITLANAGLVKRAQREVEGGELSYKLEEDAAGTVKVSWSDEIECVLPGGATLKQSRCSCPATSLCRHLLRSVLVYQVGQPTSAQAATRPEILAQSEPDSPIIPAEKVATASPANQPWNPGLISDDSLAKLIKKTVLSQARQRFEQGQVLFLTRSAKPSAHIHSLGCTVRFLVEGDARYTHCDCNEEAPCSHVPLAVWGFRLLAENQPSGLVSTRPECLPVPVALLDEIEQRLVELALPGISGLSNSLRDHLRRLEQRCREESLIWPAEITGELLQQLERYQAHDARFSPEETATLLGELLVRLAAIRNDTGAIPALFVRGSASDQLTELGSARLVGLGCGARVLRQGVELTSFMQDLSSGAVVAVRQEFSQPVSDTQPTAEPASFGQLAQTSVGKSISLGELGSGQLIIKGAKRSPNYQLKLGRAAASLNPQTYQWENLREPLLSDNLAEVQTRLAGLPPASLRPRRLTENFQVCRVAGVKEAHFSSTYQAVIARLEDDEGSEATLVHPFTTQGRAGCEVLLAWLNDPANTLRFVAGSIRPGAGSPVLHPVGLVFEQDGRREMLQPWIARLPNTSPENVLPSISLNPASSAPPFSHPAKAYFDQLLQALGELLVIGLERADRQLINFWKELLRQGQAKGFSRGIAPLQRLVEMLVQKDEQINWQGNRAAGALLDLALLVRLGQEELPGD